MLLELEKRGASVLRFNTEDVPARARLVLRLSSGGTDGRVEVAERCVELDEVDSVWYRRPGEPEPLGEIEDPDDREFAVNESEEALMGLWRVLNCTWVSRPDALNAASYKPAQIRAASNLGFGVPRTLITNDQDEARSFFDEMGGMMIVKPLRFGLVRETEEFQEVVFTVPVSEAHMKHNVEDVTLCPTFFQEYVAKDVEVRVTVVGDEVFAAEIRSQEAPEGLHDWRRANISDVPHLPHQLPEGVAERSVRLVEHLGLNFGAIDLVLTPDGRYVFLEINPNGQWLWVERLTGLPITDALVRLLMAGRGSG